MKQFIVKLNDPEESRIFQKAAFVAGAKMTDGQQRIRQLPYKYWMITEEGKILFSSDPVFYEKRKDEEMSFIEAIYYLESLVEKEQFLNRSGISKKLPFSIDKYILDQYFTLCRHQGYDPNRRIENLIAADIKAEIKGKDLLHEIKNQLQN